MILSIILNLDKILYKCFDTFKYKCCYFTTVRAPYFVRSVVFGSIFGFGKYEIRSFY